MSDPEESRCQTGRVRYFNWSCNQVDHTGKHELLKSLTGSQFLRACQMYELVQYLPVCPIAEQVLSQCVKYATKP